MREVKKIDIKCIIFDFGKTIHDFHLDFFFSWLSRKFGIPRHYFWDMFSKRPDGLLYPYECGQEPRNFFENFLRESRILIKQLKNEEDKLIIFPEITEKEFFDALNGIFDVSPPKRDRLELMRKLKGKGYKIYVLSNINKRHVDYLKGDTENGNRFSRFREIFQIVDRFIASCDDDIQCRKIRPLFIGDQNAEKIFYGALAITGTRPQEIVFIDDIIEYVNVFKGMGGNAIHCTGNWTKVEAELYQLGVRWE